MEDTKRVIVVGDQYDLFARNGSVIRASELRAKLARGWAPDDPSELLLGQGLDPADRELFLRLKSEETSSIAPLKLTHKRDLGHVMVTVPVPLGNGRYQCELVVSDLNDRLGDHVTGQHLGGMLLIEAARQASIAAVECEFANRHYGMAWSKVNVAFLGYAFPLPTSMMVQLTELPAEGRSAQVALSVQAELSQAGRPICSLEFAVGLIEAERLSQLEARRAKQALSAIGCAGLNSSEPVAMAAK
jgi:hypothetical protein